MIFAVGTYGPAADGTSAARIEEEEVTGAGGAPLPSYGNVNGVTQALRNSLLASTPSTRAPVVTTRSSSA